MEKEKPVGIWIRVSTEDQAKGESPEHHEKRARFYAESKGWKVKEVYRLEAVSGKSVMNHPETQRMLHHIRTGHITGLIFSKGLYRGSGIAKLQIYGEVGLSLLPQGQQWYGLSLKYDGRLLLKDEVLR